MAVCEELEIEMIALALYAVMIIVQSCVSCIGLRELFRIHQKNGISALSLYSQLFFFTTPMVFYIGKILSSVCWCFAPSCNTAAYAVAYIAYASHLVSLMLLLYARLRDVFGETVMKISKCLRFSFYLVLLFLITMGVMVLVEAFLPLQSSMFALSRLAECFVVTLAVCQFLAWKFVYNLYRINSKADGAQNGLKFLVLLRKYAILNLICVMFTTAYAFAVVISVSLHSYSYYWSQILTLIIMGDALVDTLCVTLSFAVYEEYYLRCCCLCHFHCPCLVCLGDMDNHELEQLRRVGTGSPLSVCDSSSAKSDSSSAKISTKFKVPPLDQDNHLIVDGKGP